MAPQSSVALSPRRRARFGPLSVARCGRARFAPSPLVSGIWWFGLFQNSALADAPCMISNSRHCWLLQNANGRQNIGCVASKRGTGVKVLASMLQNTELSAISWLSCFNDREHQCSRLGAVHDFDVCLCMSVRRGCKSRIRRCGLVRSVEPSSYQWLRCFKT